MAYKEKLEAEGRGIDIYKLFDEKAARSKKSTAGISVF